jgi:hypothetical protein
MLRQLFYRGPPIDVLHEEYAKKGRIDGEAPVRASADGPLLVLFFNSAKLRAGMQTWLTALKTAAETR